MRIAPGTLEHEISIWANDPGSPNADGNVKKGNFQSVYTGVPAKVKPVSGREVWAAERPTDQRTHTVLLRYMPGITTSHQLRFGSRVFNIAGIRNIDEADHALEIDVLEQV